MTYKEIQELIRQVAKSDLAEVKVKDAESEVTIRTKFFASGKEVTMAYQPAAQVAPINAAPMAANGDNQPSDGTAKSAQDAKSGLKEIRSPMVGTFYRSSGPDKPPYIKPGDAVSVGSVVCIVEAMKLFNEIESDISGTIVKVMVEDATPIEYDQVLFLVE